MGVGLRTVVVMLAGLASACGAVVLPPEVVPAPKQEKVEPQPVASFVTPVVHSGPRDEMRIALTFDACPTASAYDERITKTLTETKTPATLFLSGSWVKHRPQSALELANNPLFELGNHSYTHKHMPQLKKDGDVLDELLRTQEEIYNLTGRIPAYFRPPFGEFDTRLAYLVGKAGLTTIEFDLASGDPDEHATKQKLVNWVLKQARPGGIVVMHINHRQFPTAEALPEIIQGLRKRGYELVTVGQLLNERPPPLCSDPLRVSPPAAPVAPAVALSALEGAVSSISVP
ncbi:polysaccharide deacetylase family protein [Hyalangium minutum]|uniref:polysaccharide deacetylase family protein n=1 Tax=Hyalangium minutum TaxID=394096 RepID=UPI0014700074|nr:polysaccharide deacetylase family protein [Hyalangium minutum]